MFTVYIMQSGKDISHPELGQVRYRRMGMEGVLRIRVVIKQRITCSKKKLRHVKVKGKKNKKIK